MFAFSWQFLSYTVTSCTSNKYCGNYIYFGNVRRVISDTFLQRTSTRFEAATITTAAYQLKQLPSEVLLDSWV